MGNHADLDALPGDVFDDLPGYVKVAFHEHRRAGSALRLYRRRGWNPTAVLFQWNRAKQSLQEALDRWEHEELNPRLF